MIHRLLHELCFKFLFLAILRTLSPIMREIYVKLSNKADHFNNPFIELNLMMCIYKFYSVAFEVQRHIRTSANQEIRKSGNSDIRKSGQEIKMTTEGLSVFVIYSLFTVLFWWFNNNIIAVLFCANYSSQSVLSRQTTRHFKYFCYIWAFPHKETWTKRDFSTLSMCSDHMLLNKLWLYCPIL